MAILDRYSIVLVALSLCISMVGVCGQPAMPVADIPSLRLPGVTRHTLGAHDFARYTTLTVFCGVWTFVLPLAADDPMPGGMVAVVNLGAEVVTIVPSDTHLNGNWAALVLAPGSPPTLTGASIFSNGTGYFASVWRRDAMPLGPSPRPEECLRKETPVCTECP